MEGEASLIDTPPLVKSGNHEPVSLIVEFASARHCGDKCRSKIPYNTRAFDDPEVQKWFQAGLQMCTSLHNSFEATSRCHFLCKSIVKVACAVAPPPPRIPRTPWISKSTGQPCAHMHRFCNQACFHIIYDSEIAADGVLSHADIKSTKLLQAVGGVLAQSVIQLRNVQWHHVYSHQGDRGNELVDQLATRGKMRRRPCINRCSSFYLVQTIYHRQHQTPVPVDATLIITLPLPSTRWFGTRLLGNATSNS